MESRAIICDTIFYQGMISSQTQALKYVGNKKIRATTGELMWCSGKNGLQPLNVIDSLFVGVEIADVNLNPFSSFPSALNPINWIGAIISWSSNRLNGMHFMPAQNPTPQSVKFHAPVLSKMSIGQDTDIFSHQRKYQAWLQQGERTDSLILYGVSRGTATTFSAFAEFKYPEVKLVVLEGAIDSVNDVLTKRVVKKCGSGAVANNFKRMLHNGLSFFTAYDANALAPIDRVSEYPEGVPTVFITSMQDEEVPRENTSTIAHALAERGKNDVFLLELQHSSHPNYMFDDEQDRDRYEAFIHAIYAKYGIQHNEALADKGHDLIQKAQIGWGRTLDCNPGC